MDCLKHQTVRPFRTDRASADRRRCCDGWRLLSVFCLDFGHPRSALAGLFGATGHQGRSSIFGRCRLATTKIVELGPRREWAGADDHCISNPRVGSKTRRRFGERRLGLCSAINLMREARGFTLRHKGSS